MEHVKIPEVPRSHPGRTALGDRRKFLSCLELRVPSSRITTIVGSSIDSWCSLKDGNRFSDFDQGVGGARIDGTTRIGYVEGSWMGRVVENAIYTLLGVERVCPCIIPAHSCCGSAYREPSRLPIS